MFLISPRVCAGTELFFTTKLPARLAAPCWSYWGISLAMYDHMVGVTEGTSLYRQLGREETANPFNRISQTRNRVSSLEAQAKNKMR